MKTGIIRLLYQKGLFSLSGTTKCGLDSLGMVVDKSLIGVAAVKYSHSPNDDAMLAAKPYL
ncbi:hypothetical protein QN360_13395, partial [Glaciimonas sp. CA11.2]|uniref:hypothetical protein n=1 Tax=Glaciimonas sp. CA11.2 TaxID=3048601 RepID=UPI002B224E0B